MKKVFLLIAAVLIGLMTYAQQTGSPTWTPILEEHPTTVDIQLVNASENQLQVHIQVPGFFTTTVNTERGEAQVISLPKSPNNYFAGEPDLPYLVIPSIIDDQAQMGIEILASKYQDFDNVEVAPSKGDISRQIDPATVPYTYGACYQNNAFTPDQQADLFEPYILRDFRGQNIVVKPFAYNPITKTLRVYYDLTVEMKAIGKGGENVLNRKSQETKMDPEFEALYNRKFINYQEVKNRYNPVGENGELLIICYESYMNAMEPFVTWKRTIGRPTEIVGTSVTGNTASSIQSYLTSYYNSHPNLTHVLLVGDYDKIPGTYMSGLGDYSGYSDHRYGQLVGNDYYNDIFIGRFSANNTSQVTNQVNRTITYERDLNTSATWLKKGLGVSKMENGNGHNGEDDYEHIDLIRNDLLGYTYTTVYQEYAGVSGITSTTTTISNKINDGVGIINYCNHGSETSWQSHSYSNSHVNSLTNSNKLPFIISTACLNGKYDYSSGDCFAETWMHATNGSTSTPTGAIGGIFSYISQPWIPPMEGQDEMNDILVESYSNNIKRTLGGVLTNGNMAVLDYSTSNQAKGTYLTWNIFGDPTLTLRTDTPANMTVNHPGTINIGQDTYTVQVPNCNEALATISFENGIMGSAKVVNGVANITLDETPDEIADLTLCVFGYNKVTYLGTISVVGGAQYNITLGSCEHGTFEATPNPAYVGQTVTLTAHPAPGYCLAEWHVINNAKSQPVPVTNNQFVMPDGEVTVTATFVVGHNITLADVENGSITANPTTALEGTTITLTATPASGYTLGDWLVYKTGDLNTTIAVNDNQFVMPDYDVTVMAFFILPAGGNITIGSGTTTSNFIPVYAYYNYTLSQQIYTASEINGAGTLTAIAFKVANSKAQTRTIDVYLKHTTKTSFSSTTNWETMSSTNKVFSGTVDFSASDWTTITFDTPFEYDGTHNLMVCVNDQTGSWISSYSSFQTYGTNANRAIYAYNDNTGAYNPASPSSINGNYSTSNNQIQLTKVVASAASLTVTPEVLDGFSYNEGQGPSVAQPFTILGYVAEDITVTAPNDYEVSATESGTYSHTLTLPAPSSNGGLVTTNLYVRLKAGLAIGDYNGETLTVNCGEVSKTLTLNGSVLNGYHWTLTPGQYANNMTLLGVILFNDVEQRSTELEVGAFCGEEIRGVGKASYCPPVDRYILPLIIYGNEEDMITFKLYDPNLDEEFDSAPDLSYLFTTEGYGSITNPESLNFYTSAPPTTPLSATVTAEPTSVCSGEMATLTATAMDGTGNYTYNWTPANLIAEGQGTANATTTALSQTTEFTCTVSDGNETFDAMVTVTVLALPNATATADDTELCEGASTELHAAAVSGADYAWAPANMIQGDANQQNVTTVTLTETTIFSLTVTQNGCESTDEITITVNEYPEANAGEDQDAPYNTSVILTAGDAGTGATYSWSPENMIQGNANQQTVTTTQLTQTTTFTLTVTKNGCVSTDEVTVYVGSQLMATATANPTSICSGEASTLTATASNGSGDYTYFWEPDELIAGGQGTSEVETTELTETTIFTCTISDGNQTVSTTVVVTVNPLPFAFAGEDKEIPYNTSTILLAVNAGTGATYSWSPANMIQGNANQRAVTTVNLTSDQTFTLTVTKDGCEATDEVTVRVISIPEQSITLENGWKWFSSYLEYGENALGNLENSISVSNVSEARIKSQTGARFYEGGNWYGNSLTSLENENMYMVELDQILEVNFTGVIANPAEHPITLNPGWKWISFLSTTGMSLENALTSITPNEEDVIKGQGGFSTYDGTSWVGSLMNLEPGKGYMYQNMGEGNLTLIYPTTSKGTVAEDETELYWKSNPYQFAHNLSMMVSLEGVTLTEDSHEIGAFVNGECRGNARVKEVNGKAIAFLTVTGQDGEKVRFKVYDVYADEVLEANVEEQILFASDDLYGSLKQPYMLHLNTNGVDNFHGQVSVFPNPSQAGTELHIVTPNRDKTLTVEVIDLVGSVIRTEVLHDGILRGMEHSGLYTLKVTTPEGVTYYGKLIIND